MRSTAAVAIVLTLAFSLSVLYILFADFKSKDSELFDENKGHGMSENSESNEYAEWYAVVDGMRIFATSMLHPVASEDAVLLLHGAAFSSRTWKEIDTLKVLHDAGYRVIAIDLPDFGQSQQITSHNVESFLYKLLPILNLNKVIVVSPSMSGKYSIPFVLQHPERVRGFVPVAPVIELSKYKPDDFARCEVPTLIIYGEKDVPALEKNKLLSRIPHSTVHEIPNARHPAYLDDPILFHKLLLNFLSGIYT